MKQLVVISGKGGTGKTTLTSSLAYLADNRNIADCDVEAPNLNLMLNSKEIDEKEYIGGKVAKLNLEKCKKCNMCIETCRFDAISSEYEIDELKCEGCGACSYVCPSGAIDMIDDETGVVKTNEMKDGFFTYANLNIGADGAGKLVSEVRTSLKAKTKSDELIIIDGSPGIGCVVIASITGCDSAIIVTEPTQSGLEDLKRVFSLVEFFKLEGNVVINKYDINTEKTKEIEEFCNEKGIQVLGKIPFDKYINKAMKENKLVIQYKESDAGKVIKEIWEKINNKMRR